MPEANKNRTEQLVDFAHQQLLDRDCSVLPEHPDDPMTVQGQIELSKLYAAVSILGGCSRLEAVDHVSKAVVKIYADRHKFDELTGGSHD